MIEMTVWDYDAGKFWVEAVLGAWMVVTTVITWRLTRRRATTESILAVDARVTTVQEEFRRDVARLHSDFAKLDTKVANLPDHEDIGKLYERLSAVEGQLNQLIGGVAALVRGFDTINSYLLNKEKL
ncbi:MAG: hypothetical protein R3E64_04130 [Halioglobus sp.]